MQKIWFAFLCSFISFAGQAQEMSIQKYIETYKDIAIREMKRMGVPAAITLAQGILETENGNSELVRKSNNHFGIKCKSSWTGNSVYHDDDERGECFRKYNSAEESYRDHSNFLRGSERYAFLFALDPANYKGWAYGLKKAGYATNPRYPQILINHIEQYNLNQYSLEGAGETPFFDVARIDENEALMVEATTIQSSAQQATVPVSLDKTLFNGLRAVYAAKETSLLAIATKYEIPLARLLEFNDLSEDGLLTEDSWIFLEKKNKKGNRDTYTTTGKESVHDIAQLNGIQLSNLLEYNDLKNEILVEPGTVLRLKPHADLQQDKQGQDFNKHKVQPKEGLYSIARKYNVTVAELKDWNNLESDELRVGQQLIISKN